MDVYKPIHTIQDRIAFKKNASCRAKLLYKTFPCPTNYDLFCINYKQSTQTLNNLKYIFKKARVPETYINNEELCYIIYNSIIKNEFATLSCITLWKLKLECIDIKPGHVLRILDATMILYDDIKKLNFYI